MCLSCRSSWAPLGEEGTDRSGTLAPEMRDGQMDLLRERRSLGGGGQRTCGPSLNPQSLALAWALGVHLTFLIAGEQEPGCGPHWPWSGVTGFPRRTAPGSPWSSLSPLCCSQLGVSWGVSSEVSASHVAQAHTGLRAWAVSKVSFLCNEPPGHAPVRECQGGLFQPTHHPLASAGGLLGLRLWAHPP